jgi:hypothetical protein
MSNQTDGCPIRQTHTPDSRELRQQGDSSYCKYATDRQGQPADVIGQHVFSWDWLARTPGVMTCDRG